MIPLKLFRSQNKGLPDLLNWAAVVDDGIVLNKDGSLLAGFFYRGQDLASVTHDYQSHVSAIINAAFLRLGSEWTIHQDCIRTQAKPYPNSDQNFFDDPITSLIEAERREYFNQQGNSYESTYAVLFTYLPPKMIQSKLAKLMFDDEGEDTEKLGDKHIARFKQQLENLNEYLSSVLDITPMKGIAYVDEFGQEHTNDTLLQYLHYALTGLSHPINLPPIPMYLDAVIGGHDFWAGITPRIENKYVQCVAIESFPQESFPSMLATLDTLPVQFRWNTRFIFQDTVEAIAGLNTYKKKWQQKVRGFADQIFHSQSSSTGSINQDALDMVAETDTALAEANSGLVAYGYYTSVVILMHDDIKILDESAKQLRRSINNMGFTARVETINNIEAYLGSLPAHCVQNIRRPMIHSLNLADLLPLSSIWAGSTYAPCPFYPSHSPALLHAQTDGSTPFRFNLHVDDLGHTLMLGPTGSGKSTALALIAAQFRRYEHSTVFAFDKGNSLLPLTLATGGSHYAISADNDNNEYIFAPLSQIEQPSEINWVEDWVSTLIQLQGVDMTPSQRTELHRALTSMQHAPNKTLTNLQIAIQDASLKEALEAYTISGNYGQLLDAEHDDLSLTNFTCFEIEALMYRDDRIRIPVLLYLFHVIERKMQGQPCLLILDEAWLMLGHPVFKEKIREWLKVLRKANCAVLLATQSLSDAAQSGILDVLSESCPTKIFLANRDAVSDENRPLYQSLGCNRREQAIIANMIGKREYYIAGEGRRKVNLAIGPVALSFIGASSKDDIKSIRELYQKKGDQWPYYWLSERGVNYEHLQESPGFNDELFSAA